MYENSIHEAFLRNWWRSIDWVMLAFFMALICIGIVMSFAAGPQSAQRIGAPEFHFTIRHFMFLVPSFIVIFAFSFLNAKWTRRVASLLFVLAILGLIATLFLGIEIKGARRWMEISGITVQFSELVKPSLVIVTAWLFAEQARVPQIPTLLIAFLLYLATISLFIAQPDFGQTILITLVWATMLFIAGLKLRWIIILLALLITASFIAYEAFPHVQDRIDVFLNPDAGDSYQIDVARRAILNGSWFGAGLGEGVVKAYLPDAHTDFIFAVFVEEFGIVGGILLIAFFLLVIGRIFWHANQAQGLYVRYALSGLGVLLAYQVFINIGVNIQLLPAKGMTLPFISYGGSSLVGMSILAGFILALSRFRGRIDVS